MLRKIFTTLLLMLFIATPSNAACDYSDKCATPYDLAGKGTKALCTLTGSSFFAKAVAQHIIKSELKKATKENFKVKVNSYSAKDLAEGRFKGFTITGDNLEFDGIYVTDLKISTLCGFNYVELNKNYIKFKENMILKYEMEITADDLQKTMDSSDYMKELRNLNVSGLGMTFFKVEDANILIKNNKLYFVLKVQSPVFFSKKPMNVTMATDFKVEDGRIVFTKVDLENIYTRVDLSNIVYILNALNPLNFSMEILENKNTKMQVQTAKIINNKFLIDGIVFIPKNSTTQK